jgi:hypothetical protein
MEPPETKIAVLDMGSAYEAIIDDRHYVSGAQYGSVRLPAGVHKIRWAAMFGVSVMVDARGYASFEKISKVALEGGHVYKLRADRTTGHGFRAYLWIEDMTTGDVVDGEKKP